VSSLYLFLPPCLRNNTEFSFPNKDHTCKSGRIQTDYSIIREEEDTSTAENLKLLPMCLTKDASSSATADGGRVQSVLLSSTKSITTNCHHKRI